MERPPVYLFIALLFAVDAGVVRVPKIYNALISSDANLAPSRAYPVLEPVYRTTALGVAFPPLIVHPGVGVVPSQAVKSAMEKDEEKESTTEAAEQPEGGKEEETAKKNPPPRIIPELAYHGTLYPLAVDPYFPYAYTPDFLYPAVPFYQQPVFAGFPQEAVAPKKVDKVDEQELQGAQPAQAKVPTNHEKQPDIPDVPPPPLPVKEKRKA